VPRKGRPSRETVYQRFAAAVDELGHFGGLPIASEARQIWDDIWYLEAHNSTALEGNTLALREVEVLLEEGRAVGAKALKDYMEVLGYAEAARWVYGQAIDPGGWSTGELLSVTEIRNVHRVLMAKVWEVAPHPNATERETPGSFREHDIHPFGGGMQPPPWPEVPSLVVDWVSEVVRLGAGINSGEVEARAVPAELAGTHSRFERIHPFLDGNGRAGRLILNLLLVRLGYPPAVIFKRQRNAYLDGLDRADKADPAPLAELIARAVIDNLHRFVVPNIAGPARLVPLASLATETMSYEALRQAARRGRLEAEQGSDGLWRSSRRAVIAYERSRFSRHG
jgi:Fic family protein